LTEDRVLHGVASGPRQVARVHEAWHRYMLCRKQSRDETLVYVPRHFEDYRVEELRRILDRYPLGTLVVAGPDGLDANHIPFEMVTAADGTLTLHAHVARANPVWQQTRTGADVLVIFRGGDAYISPSWYPSKHEAHRQVPTWNYQVVHVHGKIAIHDDARFVRGIVARLTRRHEARAGNERPWRMTDSEPAYIDDMLTKIVGIEVVPERIVVKSKLSQNKEDRDRLAAAEELGKRGELEVSSAMRDAPTA
jgi:transcriptional regulator